MDDFTSKIERVREELSAYKTGGKRLFATSSFQTNSVVLLHILGRVAPDVPVYFLNTGFHFPETLAFKRALGVRFGLTIREVISPVPRIQQRESGGRLLFAVDPDYCCHLNKVLPLEPVLLSHDVWVNGVRASQSATRAGMGREQPAKHGILRYHPLLDWTSPMVHDYLVANDLPRHPLEADGYFSVGCRPCTRKLDPEALYDDRTGRWFGLNKTECGLHTDLGRGVPAATPRAEGEGVDRSRPGVAGDAEVAT